MVRVFDWRNMDNIMVPNDLRKSMMRVSQLTPYMGNAKKHPDWQVEQIANSIQAFGFNDPIAIWDDIAGHHVIVEGHGRLLAAKLLGMEEVPVIRLDQLDDEARRAYTLAHNKLTMNTDFDIQLLDSELDAIEGFDTDPLDREDYCEPVQYFTDEEIIDAAVSNWVVYDTPDDMAGEFIDPALAMHQFNRLCAGENIGTDISLLFNAHRLDTPTYKAASVFEASNSDEKFRRRFCDFMVSNGNVCSNRLYAKRFGVGYNGVQYVNEFLPYVARDVYKRFVKEGDTVLNPCAGWGGRLIGFASCMFENVDYIETDPSESTYRGLVKLKDFLKLGDNVRQYNLPFEDLDIPSESVDFVFTSPPYFNTELYSDDAGQSYKQADSYEGWLSAFYEKMLDKIIDVMRPGALCVLNIGNARFPMSRDTIRLLHDRGIDAFEDTSFDKIASGGIKHTSDHEPFICFRK